MQLKNVFSLVTYGTKHFFIVSLTEFYLCHLCVQIRGWGVSSRSQTRDINFTNGLISADPNICICRGVSTQIYNYLQETLHRLCFFTVSHRLTTSLFMVCLCVNCLRSGVFYLRQCGKVRFSM